MEPARASIDVAPASAPIAPAAPTTADLTACGLRASLRRPSTAVSVIATVAVLAAAWIGAAFWVPLVVAITLATLLWPALRRAERVVRSRVVAALLVMATAVGATLVMAVLIASQLSAALDHVPDVLRQAARDVQSLPNGGPGTFQRTQQALDELDRAVAKATGTARASTTDPASKQGGSIVAALVAWFSSLLVSVGRSATGVLLQAGAIVLLSFFLLCSGDRLAHRVSLWCDGQELSRARLRLNLKRGAFSPLVSELAREMRQFGAVTLFTNVCIAVAVGVGFAAFGVDDAWAWGLVAGALHFVPYAGLALTMVLAAVEVYVTQSSALAALLAAVYVAIVGVTIGSGLAVWLQGRASRADSAVTFGGTVFFSVLWGGWGLVLGPLLVVSGQAVWRHVAGAQTSVASPVPVAEAIAAVPVGHMLVGIEELT